jgi:hypothetical protein
MTYLIYPAKHVHIYIYLSRIDTCIVHINSKKIKKYIKKTQNNEEDRINFEKEKENHDMLDMSLYVLYVCVRVQYTRYVCLTVKIYSRGEYTRSRGRHI